MLLITKSREKISVYAYNAIQGKAFYMLRMPNIYRFKSWRFSLFLGNITKCFTASNMKKVNWMVMYMISLLTMTLLILVMLKIFLNPWWKCLENPLDVSLIFQFLDRWLFNGAINYRGTCGVRIKFAINNKNGVNI